MKNFRLHHFSFILMVLSVVTLSQAFILMQDRADAQTTTQCSTGSIVTVGNTTGTSTSFVNGVANVALSVSPTLAPTVKTVTFYLDNEQNVLGRGLQVSTNPYWQMQWHSQVSPAGSHTVGAVLGLTTGSCLVTPASVQVTAQTTAAMNVASLPGFFDGYTNEPRNFSLKTGLSGGATFDVTPWTIFQVSTTNLGVVTQDADMGFRFSAGTVAGTGTIKVVAKYGGISRVLDIPVSVRASTTTQQSTTTAGTTTTNPEGTTTTTSGTTSRTTSTTGTTTTAPLVQNVLPTDLKGDETVRSCVVAKVTQARYDLIIAGKERPTAQEFEAFQICFASRNYVLPVGWVPVAPKKETVQARPANEDIKVAKAQTVINEVNGAKKQALKFSGVAKPNAKVLLYIFSEPLVVSTDTNANGEWSYSLEDPIEPGKHEAYAMVNKGDGTYERSSVFNFAIARVEAAAANPNGLSLTLEGNQATAAKDNRSMTIYIVSVVTVVLLGGGILAWLIMRRKSGLVIDGATGTVLPTSGAVVTSSDDKPAVTTSDTTSGTASDTTVTTPSVTTPESKPSPTIVSDITAAPKPTAPTTPADDDRES